MNDDDNGHDNMLSGLAVPERELLLAELQALPDTPPPRAVWERIAEQAEAEGLFARRPTALSGPWLALGGAAAAAVLALAVLPLAPQPDTGPFPTEPVYSEPAPGADLAALRTRSQGLEHELRALPAAPNVMRVGTAATIGELEDRIAAIDALLNDPAVVLDEAEEARYWRERVRLMDSLLRVRTAQAQRNSL